MVRNLLFFDSMLTPKIITIIYWIMLALAAIGGLISMFTVNFFVGLFSIVFGAIGARIWCELLIVIFKMNEALQQIRNK